MILSYYQFRYYNSFFTIKNFENLDAFNWWSPVMIGKSLEFLQEILQLIIGLIYQSQNIDIDLELDIFLR